jgi:exodeoxyribonuclease V alpha subunit
MNSCPSYLLRVTNLYRFDEVSVEFGAVAIDSKTFFVSESNHFILVRTNRSKVNIKPEPGQQWLVEGIYKTDVVDVKGTRLNRVTFDQPDSVKCLMPKTGKAFVDFISKGDAFKGIGAVRAKILWDRYVAVDGNPDRLFLDLELNNFEAINKVFANQKSTQALLEGFNKYRNLKYVDQLVEWEVDQAIHAKLFTLVSNGDVCTFLKSNPYVLFSLGMDFDKVDQIAQKYFSSHLNDELRIAAAVEFAVKKRAQSGHTAVTWSEVQQILSKVTLLTDEQIEKAKSVQGRVMGFVKVADFFMLTGNYIFEKSIALRFKYLSNIYDRWTSTHETAYSTALARVGFTLTVNQLAAVRSSLINGLSAITGGAGTGKTSTVATIVDAYTLMGYQIYPVALSGKATRRLSESIRMTSLTIARFLQKPVLQNEKILLICDEASMLDSSTMWRLITHIPQNTRILLVGDPHQLPPINPGLVLLDYIKSGRFPIVELDIVKRQANKSTIPVFSNKVKNGETPNCLTSESGDIVFVDSSSIIEQCVSLYKSAADECVIVAPTNSTVEELNNLAQLRLNESGAEVSCDGFTSPAGKYRLRINDPVVFTMTDHAKGVENGLLGRIKSACSEQEFICKVETNSGDIIDVDWQMFTTLELGYALTLHKVQGSQADTVIVALTASHLVDRSWLYTSITRATKQVYLVGSRATVVNAINRPSPSLKRRTALAHLLTM